MIFKTKKYPAIKQSYCVVASYRLAAHASIIVGHDNLPVLNLIVKQKRRSYDRPQFCELIGLLVLNTRHRVSILVLHLL